MFLLLNPDCYTLQKASLSEIELTGFGPIINIKAKEKSRWILFQYLFTFVFESQAKCTHTTSWSLSEMSIYEGVIPFFFEKNLLR